MSRPMVRCRCETCRAGRWANRVLFILAVGCLLLAGYLR
jgi:hypothetical protein